MGKNAVSIIDLKSGYQALVESLCKCYGNSPAEVELLKQEPNFLAEACEYYCTNKTDYNNNVHSAYLNLYNQLFTYFENLELKEPLILHPDLKLVLIKGRKYFRVNNETESVKETRKTFKEDYTSVITLANLTIQTE